MTSDSQNLEQRVAQAVQEDVAIVPYDPQWPVLFQEEEKRLRSCLSSELIGRSVCERQNGIHHEGDGEGSP
jgi:GrpB-like predicted nucleotidyltransferase (UPF0157 family)